MRYQKPIKNRKFISAGTTAQIRHRIESLARQFDCSKSFVTNTLLADKLGIEIEERYYDEGRAAFRTVKTGTRKTNNHHYVN
jgi:hypothetical protein